MIFFARSCILFLQSLYSLFLLSLRSQVSQPAVIGQRQVTHWTCHQFITRTNLETNHSSRLQTNLCFQITSHNAFGRWKEAGEPAENQGRHKENKQTPHRKFPGAAVITTALFHHPCFAKHCRQTCPDIFLLPIRKPIFQLTIKLIPTSIRYQHAADQAYFNYSFRWVESLKSCNMWCYSKGE